MKFYKPKFWEKKNFISIILYPLSIVIYCLIVLKKKVSKIYKTNIPIICVGNIYIGGTGKTPLSIFLANELLKRGMIPAIVRKYYKNHKDEHLFLSKYFKNVIIDESRIKGIFKAEKKNLDCVILDDGLQDYTIKKDVNILCFNQKQLIGNGMTFPSGPLRESLSAIRNAHFVIINGLKDLNFEKKLIKLNKDIDIFYSNYKIKNIDHLKNEKLLAFAGIGNPGNFFNTLEENGLKITKKFKFPDHYEYKRNEIQSIFRISQKEKLKVVTTEKDFLRIKHLGYDEINSIEEIKVELELINKGKFIDNFLKVYDKFN